jgi:hypothetical protein
MELPLVLLVLMRKQQQMQLVIQRMLKQQQLLLLLLLLVTSRWFIHMMLKVLAGWCLALLCQVSAATQLFVCQLWLQLGMCYVVPLYAKCQLVVLLRFRPFAGGM